MVFSYVSLFLLKTLFSNYISNVAYCGDGKSNYEMKAHLDNPPQSQACP